MLSLSLTSAPVLLFLFFACTISATSIQRDPDTDLKTYYTRAHSLGDNYYFDPREWESVNATDLSYKYDQPTHVKRDHKTKSTKSNKDSGGGGVLFDLAEAIKAGLKGIGNAQKVEITW